jgi:hypothetical protein
MPDLVLNRSVAAEVVAYELGLEEVNEDGAAFRPRLGVKPGVRLDVQSETIALHTALLWGFVDPAEPVHDPGPNGVRLFAESINVFQSAAPPSDPPSVWDLFLEAVDEVGA